ncbi:MAG: NADPH-dependent 7-cyano-7-deazaguanine reductase QueF [bacterium]|nr:NADPH-dependent 7-cyano-7-deazaguanine reductase QueF [bacterium]
MSERKYLGKKISGPTRELDLIDWEGGEIDIELEAEEFTSLCPVTGQPDFGTILIRYRPDRFIVETKSLKLYLWSFREEPSFVEQLVNTMADELFGQIQPQWLEVEGRFNSRGGIRLNVSTSRESD